MFAYLCTFAYFLYVCIFLYVCVFLYMFAYCFSGMMVKLHLTQMLQIQRKTMKRQEVDHNKTRTAFVYINHLLLSLSPTLCPIVSFKFDAQALSARTHQRLDARRVGQLGQHKLKRLFAHKVAFVPLQRRRQTQSLASHVKRRVCGNVVGSGAIEISQHSF